MLLKRKRNDLALSDKFRVVELLDQGKTQMEIAKSLDCSQAQISRISRSRAEIRAEYESNTNPDRKRHRTGKAPDVENALNVWFADARARDIPINGSILAEKSEALAKLMKKDDFKATDGWLSRWKKRQNIGFKPLHGESKDADTTAADNWVSNVLPGLLRDYDANDIYNADETKRIFHGVMVRIGKVEPEGWPVRSGPSFSEVQITGLPEGSTFPILANDPVIDYFSCLSTLIYHLTPQLNVFCTFT